RQDHADGIGSKFQTETLYRVKSALPSFVDEKEHERGNFILWQLGHDDTGLSFHYCYVDGGGALHHYLEREQLPAAAGILIYLTHDIVGTHLLDYQAVHLRSPFLHSSLATTRPSGSLVARLCDVEM